MSNPTSNFGWPMPTPTDLVTDLPADFEVFGQAVDTDLAGLNGGTTGQILSKTSATDLAFTWINNDQGDITGVTAGTGISGGGTSGTVTVTNSMATAITTSGDLIQGTGSGTFARLATGTNGQYLTTNGTTNSWAAISAGGITQLATGSLNGVSTVTINSISQSYKHLYAVVQNQQAASGTTNYRPNNYSTNNYTGVACRFDSATWLTFNASTSFSDRIDAGAVANFMSVFEIPNYTLTGYKVCTVTMGGSYNAESAYTIGRNSDTTAVSSLTIRNGDSVNWTAGTYTLYGVS